MAHLEVGRPQLDWRDADDAETHSPTDCTGSYPG